MASLSAQSNQTKADNPPAPIFHPLMLELIPEMEPDAFAKFVADIKQHGVHEPIWMHKGQILDGRNRWLACEQLGIKCPRREYTGDEAGLLDFVISENYHRRHWDASQRAMVAAKAATMRKGARTDLQPRPNLAEVSIEAAAKRMDVSTGNVKNAKKVIAKGAPEVVKAVEQGKLAVSAAAKIVEHPPDVQRDAASKIKDGENGAAVVRALPPSPAKTKKTVGSAARRQKTDDRVVSIADEKKRTEEMRRMANVIFVSLLKTEELWLKHLPATPHPLADIWPLLDSEEQEEVVRAAKVIQPWVAEIVKLAEKVNLRDKSHGRDLRA
jgi:ParB-like chromosome segregation protein Spo0J